MNRDYKLLTPGPLTTTRTVKEEMLFDHCTWDDDYKAITQKIRADLLELAHCNPSEYTTVLMQGSGTFGVESVLTSVIGADEKVLLCTNGAYGDRQVKICEHAGIDYVQYAEPYDRIPDAAHVAEILDNDPSITHVSMIHSETTSGLLNDIESVARVAKAHGCTFIVDAMSSFGGVDIPVADWGIDFLVSSANKCIQGVPGFSFIICNTAKLEASRGKARSLSLDLWDQWNTLEKDGGKWRYTSPTHVVLAFNRALDEMKAEGSIPARSARYATNNRMLIARMKALGFGTFLKEHQGPIITTFTYPEGVSFDFADMYAFMIFHNMQVLRLMDVRRVAKVGDTISDIKEGRNAGVFTVGVTEGSSQMGLSLAEFEALSPAEQDRERLMAREAFLATGADAVINTMAELPALLLG